MSDGKSNAYTLHYFNGRGLAEGIRFIFHATNTPFTDRRYTSEEWQRVKASQPFNKIPVLEFQHDGTVTFLPQSRCIERFLARKHNLYGKNEIHAAFIDAMGEQILDLRRTYTTRDAEIKALSDGPAKEALVKKTDEEIHEHFALIDKFLTKHNQHPSGGAGKGPFMFGETVSLADIQLFFVFDNIMNHKGKPHIETLHAQYPAIKASTVGVRHLPGIDAYLASRPKTDF